MILMERKMSRKFEKLKKNSPRFLWHNFNDFMEKEPCANFCGALISSHKVMGLQRFELSMSDIISAYVQNISFLVFFAYLC